MGPGFSSVREVHVMNIFEKSAAGKREKKKPIYPLVICTLSADNISFSLFFFLTSLNLQGWYVLCKTQSPTFRKF